jgi:hypothetical protein
MAKTKHKPVKFSRHELAAELPEELDFSKLKLLGRGPKAIAAAAQGRIVKLDPDVAKVFGDPAAVNAALRGLIQLARHTARRPRKTA